mmetsp:Transcript_9629/g.23703  ORF Transcript_9629/g.23703 Transcript_9629/m.23703 type:complete len:759 (+) Transcript_9629:24-2300(+)|eukprot:CAMPEP_0114525436 /NCGR_PEP_ID=MMETSP0109-20121206/22422_1 /TAXON_ID=29199 /ORGANISM="Chlorarachnion reptans, Strain CCCM449" /LENGTH=758 /DNA_ID=CAMNT_0001707015 /DNA_START=22 /DNA_END=2298 /DNA_ORIENTATION=+
MFGIVPFLAIAAVPIAIAEPWDGWSNPCENDQFSGLPFCNTKLSVNDRVNDLIGRIPQDEKLGLFTNQAKAAPSVGIKEYKWWSEALHGVANSDGVIFDGSTPFATSFPQVQTTSMSWNISLFSEIGKLVGIESRAFFNVKHAGLTFWTPNINIIRDPRWGRGQETPGEDPFLNGMYAIAFVRAMQEDPNAPNLIRASACCKHFEAYSMEEADGFSRHNFSAKVSPRDEAEVYRPAFEACISEGRASGVMCSYNAVNGVPSCASYELNTELVRNQWGFDGYITSDCAAVSDVWDTHNYTKTMGEAINVTFSAGMDIGCDDNTQYDNMSTALSNGDITMDVLDRALFNLERVRMRLGMYDPSSTSPFNGLGPDDVATDAHRQVALQAAREGTVLLKNAGSVLPFTKKEGLKIAVIGPHGNTTDVMLGNYNGIPKSIVSVLEGLQSFSDDVEFTIGCLDGVFCEDDGGFDDAVASAENADLVVLAVGISIDIEAEGLDRTNMFFPGSQVKLITEVSEAATKAGVPLAMVVLGGCAIDLGKQKDSDDVPAIVWAGYPGEKGGQAIAEILFGDVNPSGKTTQTFYPESFCDQVKMTDMRMRPDPKDGFPGRGYRFWTGEPVYPFGFGLSYTTFGYQWRSMMPKHLSFDAISAALEKSKSMWSSEAFGMNLNTTVAVTNSGDRAGAEVVIAYARPPNAGHFGNPKKVVVGFEKVYLEAGESTEVQFNIRPQQLALANENGKFEAVRGDWIIEIGGLECTSWVV